MRKHYPDLCFILDVNAAWLKYPLRKRGFLVFAPHEDYPPDTPDSELLEYARKNGCVVVSYDKFFMNKDRAIYIPPEWVRKYNSWELVSKIIKHASLKSR